MLYIYCSQNDVKAGCIEVENLFILKFYLLCSLARASSYSVGFPSVNKIKCLYMIELGLSLAKY